MKIKKIDLQNFRNYEKLTLKLNPYINFIYGENGQGKTNLLEAIHLCTCAKSHRTSRDQELKNKKSNYYQVTLSYKENDNQLLKFEENNLEDFEELKIHYDEKRHIYHNGLKLNRLVDMMGLFHSVIFAPEDIQIVKEGPAYRRQYMDLLLAQTSKIYFSYLSKGQKLIQHKNALLKQLHQKYYQKNYNQQIKIQELYEECRPWDEQISKIWAFIFVARYELMKNLKNRIRKAYQKLSCEKEEITINYKPYLGKNLISLFLEKEQKQEQEKEYKDIEDIIHPNYILNSPYHLDNINKISNFLEKKLEENFEEDLLKKQNNLSYTKDDINFFLNSENIKNFASQGQMRSIVLALKIAELDYLSDFLKYRPVLLLDDVLSELDYDRRNALLSLISDEQVIITCTDVEETKYFFEQEKLQDKIAYYKVKAGIVEKQEE